MRRHATVTIMKKGLPVSHFTSTRAVSRRAALILLITAAACGGAADDGEPAASSEATARSTADGAGQGTLVMDGARHPFSVRSCDLLGTDGDDVILRGSGTTEDGRRLRVELERSPGDASGAWEVQNVFVMFGSIADGEAWSAKRHSGDDGNWYAGEISTEPAPGPLIEIDSGSVSVAAALDAEGDGTAAEVEIEARCP